MAHAAKYAASATGHMLSHYDRSKSHLGENIDPERTNLNYNLAPHREGGQLEFIHKRMAEVRCLKRADVNVLCDWVVTLPKYKPFRTDIHITPNKEAVERLFFERVYQFLCNRYGEKNVVSAFVHRDETTPHIHFAFLPITADKKHGGEKLSAKEVITRQDLKTFHRDLERHLGQFRDWEFEILNEATKDGNKTVAELKKQTAHEEVLKEQEKAVEARRATQQLEQVKKGLEGEITALQTTKERLTAQEVKDLKGEKTLLGGLKGVSFKDYEALKRTAEQVDSMAVKVESIAAERDQALARAERADQRATAAYADANRQLSEKIKEVEADRPSLKMQTEVVQLRMENDRLRKENGGLAEKLERARHTIAYLLNILKEKLPEIYAAVTQRNSPVADQTPEQKPKPKRNRDMER